MPAKIWVPLGKCWPLLDLMRNGHVNHPTASENENLLNKDSGEARGGQPYLFGWLPLLPTTLENSLEAK